MERTINWKGIKMDEEDQDMSEDTSAAIRVGVEALKLIIAQDKEAK